MPEEKLPYRVLTKATEMFGGPTGFSYAEMERFFLHEFAEHPGEFGQTGGTNRRTTFEWWLSQFPIQKQSVLLERLCRGEYKMWHGEPSKKDRDDLKAMLGQTPITVGSLTELVNSESIREIWQKALDRRLADPEGAITVARTLLESVCKNILDHRGIEYGDNADLPKLYGLAAKELNLAPNQHTEEAFKKILGGAHSIVDGLANLRNRLGDAHGQGKRPVKPAPRHAELAVNMAGSVASYLLATFEARK